MSLLVAQSAFAQLRVRTTDLNYRVGQEGSVFLEADHAEPFTTSELALPAGWKLKQVAVVQNGREIACSWSSESGSSVYRIRTEEAPTGAFRIALTLEAPEYQTRGSLSITPLETHDGSVVRRRSADQARVELVAEPAYYDDRRLAGSFGGMDRLRLKLDELSMFQGSSYTAELWFRTTARDQVLLSTWTGREEDAYPIELVLSPGGDLRFYRGRPGEHVSMSSSTPVADGRWHHVAVVYDDIRGWSRLLIDGEPADSLYGSVGSAFSAATRVFCVGGRCPDDDDDEVSRATGFLGLMDDLRLWPAARTVRQIKSTLGEDLSSVAGMIAVRFDDAVPGKLRLGRDRIDRTPSDLLFFDPVRGLEAQVGEESVVISWQADTRNTSAFLVERSVDGTDFREIGRVEPSESRERDRHQFVDESAPDGVAYYRVQQELNGAVKRPSGMLKVGLGKPEIPDLDQPRIVGNFPNPFSTSTTIAFALNETQQVTVSVWDLSGHQVALLLDAVVSEGQHEIAFTAGDLPSGTYFVRLQTDETISSRTLIVAR